MIVKTNADGAFLMQVILLTLSVTIVVLHGTLHCLTYWADVP